MTRRKSKLSPETAGINYATEQVESEYFMNWVFDQIYEASKMDPKTVHPLETKADAKRAAKKMLQQLEWDTKRDLMAKEIERMLGIDRATPDIISEFYDGLHRGLSNPSTVDWLADEILEARGRSVETGQRATEARRSMPQRRWGPCRFCGATGWTSSEWQWGNPIYHHDRPQGGQCLRALQAEPGAGGSERNVHSVGPTGRETNESSVVRDYIAVDKNDRRVAGPFRSQGEAQQHVPPGGYVKFSSAQHRRAPPAPSSYPMFREGRTVQDTWVPPALSQEGITPRMLEILLYGMGEHAGGARVPMPGDSVTYDKEYTALSANGYIALKRKTEGLSSFGDYYVLTDKGAGVLNRYRVEQRKLAGGKAEPPPVRRRRRRA